MTSSSGNNNMPSLVDPGFSLQRHRKVVLVVDLVESVSLMQADELGVIQRWQAFLAHVNQVVLPHNEGRLVKSLGDGLMMEFDAAPRAAAAASAMHDWMTHQCAPLRLGDRLQLRAGMHAADVYVDQHDIYGTGVNIAARMATLAGPGETVATTEARDELTDGLDGTIEDLGSCYLKHLGEPVRAYKVGEKGAAAPPPAGFGHSSALQPTIAVVPFESRVSDPEHFAIGELIADAVIGQLGRTADLVVVSRLSTTAFRGRSSTTAEVAKYLSAGYVLSGSYVTSGEKILVTAELAEASSHRVIWTERLHGEIGDLLLQQSEIGNSISRAAHAALLASEVQRATVKPLSTLQSYSLLIGAISFMHRSSRADFDRAGAMLEHLIERNKRHAHPHAWLANWHALRVTQGASEAPEADTQRALYCARKALELDPSCSLALAIDGVLHTNLMRDVTTAKGRFDGALAANPNEALAWLFKGVMHGFLGEGELALEAAERSLALSPCDPLKHYFESLAATAALGAGDYKRAIELATSSLRGNRTHPSTFRSLAIACAMSGDIVAGRKAVEGLLAMAPAYRLDDFKKKSGWLIGPLGAEYARALERVGLT
ncbi:TolB amino-terminal domain-containing protein [Variovorax sp. CF079]|nr:TolB amino-terminal domain-containing protein [Variovorax sp. CF079]